jgi:putative oligomerization/nucleic acid binding protein/phospholipase D-like protein
MPGPRRVVKHDRRSEVLAYDYPLLGALWTMFIFFLWIIWFFLLFRVIVDIFRSHDMGGWAKAVWLLCVIVLPFLGVFVYVIARGDAMSRHDVETAQAQKEAFDAYVRETAGTGGSADQLAKLADLRERGVLSEAEFEREKTKILTA